MDPFEFARGEEGAWNPGSSVPCSRLVDSFSETVRVIGEKRLVIVSRGEKRTAGEILIFERKKGFETENLEENGAATPGGGFSGGTAMAHVDYIQSKMMTFITFLVDAARVIFSGPFPLTWCKIGSVTQRPYRQLSTMPLSGDSPYLPQKSGISPKGPPWRC